MCNANEKVISIKNDTFDSLKEDFDTILQRTMDNMTMRGAEDAVITIKLAIAIEKENVRDYQLSNDTQDITREVKIPTFKHDISSVMTVKEKKSGIMSDASLEMVYDGDEMKWVVRKIDDGQMSMYDEQEEKVYEAEVTDVEYTDVEDEDIAEPPMLEAPEEEKKPVITPYSWLKQFVGKKLKVVEVLGNYTARTEDDKIVLSAAESASKIFYCSPEKLSAHVGHILKVEEDVESIYIICEDCNEVIYILDNPDFEEEYCVNENVSAKTDEAPFPVPEEDFEYSEPDEE